MGDAHPSISRFLSGICVERAKSPNMSSEVCIDRLMVTSFSTALANPRGQGPQLAIGWVWISMRPKTPEVAQKVSCFQKSSDDAAIIHCIRNIKEINETQAVLKALGSTPLSGRTNDGRFHWDFFSAFLCQPYPVHFLEQFEMMSVRK